MPPKLYEHERHPLDIIEEEDAKSNTQVSISTTPEQRVIDRTSSFPHNLSFNILQYEVALHLGREYMYLGNKDRRKQAWPTTQQEMIAFLEEKGMKE